MLHSIWLKLAVLAVVAVGVIILVTLFPWDAVPGLLVFMQEHPGLTLPPFFIANTLAVVVLLPGAAFQMVGGAVYGLWIGWLVSFAGTSAGVLLAFLLGRYLFKESLSGWIISKFPHYGAVEAAIFKDDGWKLVWLLRLTPGLPDSLLNYAMGLTSCGFPLFALASCTSLFGYAFLYAYLGHASRDIIATIRSGEVGNAKLRLGLTLGSVLLGCCTLVYLIVVLQRALKKVLHEQDAASDAAGVEDGHHLLSDANIDADHHTSSVSPAYLPYNPADDHSGGSGGGLEPGERQSPRSSSPTEVALSVRPSHPQDGRTDM